MAAGDVRIGESWRAPLAVEFESPYMAGLRSFLTREKGQGKRIFPKGAEYFRALDLTPLVRDDSLDVGDFVAAAIARFAADAAKRIREHR